MIKVISLQEPPFVGFLGMELLGPLAVGFRNVDAFFGGERKKGSFGRNGDGFKYSMLRMLDAKNVRLDVFEAESCVGFFIHSFCSKGAFFVRRTGMYIYSYSDHVIPARNGWRV